MLAVYGTLRRGASADLSKSNDVSFIGQDLITAEMFHLGGFPGVVNPTPEFTLTQKGGSVVVDVFELNSESIIRRLDSYEGYPDLYNRVQVRTANGEEVWVYTYNGMVDGREKISSGDWMHR